MKANGGTYKQRVLISNTTKILESCNVFDFFENLKSIAPLYFYGIWETRSTNPQNFNDRFFLFYRSPAPEADAWESNRPSDSQDRETGQEGSEERGRGGYDGPAGMDPDGLIDSNWDEVCENFDDMHLREELLRGIYAYGKNLLTSMMNLIHLTFYQ